MSRILVVLFAFVLGAGTAIFGPGATLVALLIVAGLFLVGFLIRAAARSRVGPALGAGVALLVVLWVLVLSPGAIFSRRHLNVDGFDRIKSGMSLQQVERLMGGAAGNYGGNSWRDAGGTLEGFFCPAGSERFAPPDGLRWTTDSRSFEVCFARGRVVATHERARYGQGFSLFGRLGRLVGAD